MTQTQHVAGIKVWAQHQYGANVTGWIETYAVGDEWHGVNLDDHGYQQNQVYADNFVFVDGTDTNQHGNGSCWYLGSSTYGVAHNILIARNKIHACGATGGTGGDHAFYAADASGNIVDNWIWDSLGFGIQFYPNAFSLNFSYNVVDGQEMADVIFASSGGNDVSSRNIFANNPTGYNSCCATSSGNEADHTWFFNVGTRYTGGGYTQAGGDGSGDPLFVDQAGHNYNIKTGSPATGYGPRVALP